MNKKINENLIWPLDNLETYPFSKIFKIRDHQIRFAWQIIDFVFLLLHKNINKKSISSKAEISPSAIIKGNVVIKAGVKIMEHAKVIGPSFIGKNVIIGNGSLIRESFISDNCVIGYLIDVARSYVGNSCWLTKTHVADSFLDDEVNIGGGTVLASLRLDNKCVNFQIKKRKISTNKIKLGAIIGKKTQIGANVTVLPGVKIGKNCIIGAGVVVPNDIKDNLYCKVKHELIFRKNEIIYNGNIRHALRKKLNG